jgi:hypothetical protein
MFGINASRRADQDMRDDVSSPDGPPLPPPCEAGQPVLVVGGLACFDEWDTLALAGLPMRNLLRNALQWIPVRPRHRPRRSTLTLELSSTWRQSCE